MRLDKGHSTLTCSCQLMPTLNDLRHPYLQDPESVEALLAAAFQLLAERGDPRARGGAFLRLAIRRLGTASAQLHDQQPG
jgi:hypothetical protein